VLFDKVPGGLFGWDGDQRDTLVRRFEPDDLRLVLLTVGLGAVAPFASRTLSFLFLLGGLAAGAQKAQGTILTLDKGSLLG
jgi:hypothetical protein